MRTLYFSGSGPTCVPSGSRETILFLCGINTGFACDLYAPKYAATNLEIVEKSILYVCHPRFLFLDFCSQISVAEKHLMY